MDVSVPQSQPLGIGGAPSKGEAEGRCGPSAWSGRGETITLQLLAKIAGDNRLAKTRMPASSSPAARRALGGRRDVSIARWRLCPSSSTRLIASVTTGVSGRSAFGAAVVITRVSSRRRSSFGCMGATGGCLALRRASIAHRVPDAGAPVRARISMRSSGFRDDGIDGRCRRVRGREGVR